MSAVHFLCHSMLTNVMQARTYFVERSLSNWPKSQNCSVHVTATKQVRILFVLVWQYNQQVVLLENSFSPHRVTCTYAVADTVLLTGVVVGLANPEPFEAYTRDACSTCGSSFYATKGLSSRTSCCQQRITPKPPVFRTFQVCLLKLHESLFEPKQLRLQGDAVDAFVLGDEVSVVACVLSTGVMNDSSTPIGIPGMDEPRTLLVSSVEALNVG
eukprot:m.318367 g.318367  ORF g.318367 m.318367 type:complete len:214 (+) comp15990_c0_seq12:1234-1875(+)